MSVLCFINSEHFYNQQFNVIGGQWVIGGHIEEDRGGVTSAKKNERVWPSQVEDWNYWNGSAWLSDPRLTVTGTQCHSVTVSQYTSQYHITSHMFFVLVSSFYL